MEMKMRKNVNRVNQFDKKMKLKEMVDYSLKVR